MKNYSLLFLLIPFYQCSIISMESKPSWYNLPDTVIMPIIAISEIPDKQSLCLVNKQLARLASKKNIDKLIQFPCILSRNYHLNLMVKEATDNKEPKMFLIVKNAPLCNHDDAVDIISYFIAADDSSTLTDLSVYKNDHHDDHIQKLLPIIMKVYRADKNLYENYTNNFPIPKEPDSSSVLQIAAYYNHLSPAELFVAQENQGILDFHTKKENISGFFPLYIAAHNNYLDMVKLLCQYSKANIDAQLDNGETALLTAVEKGYLNCARYLLHKKANINISTQDKGAPLFVATRNCDVKMVKLLITEETIIDTLSNNLTPLFIAVCLEEVNRNHQLKIITMLLKAGANPDIQNQTIFSTPLMLAADTHNYTIAQLLLEYKASVNIQSKSGDTALILATHKDDYDMMQLLLNHKADPNICNTQKRTALHEAANNSNLEGGELLFKNGALLDVQDMLRDTPLMILMNKNNFSITAKKMKKEINWEKAGSSLNSFKMAKSLLTIGANPNITDINGNTALISAIFFNNIAMIDLLLQHGADPTIKNLKGDNAYSLSWNNEIKELLEKTKKSKDTENCIIS